jgi:D-arabinose 1-dehydrogenase-like Zn-dependent alcohol dehydrogenase
LTRATQAHSNSALHLAEGDLAPKRRAVTPGLEVVGRVDALGPQTSRFQIGERIGVAWLGATDMTCRFCMRGAENLCLNPRFTGWDQDGGYEVPPLNYDRDLSQERRLRSVTANTRVDGEEFLAIASRIGINVTTKPYPLAEADKALIDLSPGQVPARLC